MNCGSENTLHSAYPTRLALYKTLSIFGIAVHDFIYSN